MTRDQADEGSGLQGEQEVKYLVGTRADRDRNLKFVPTPSQRHLFGVPQCKPQQHLRLNLPNLAIYRGAR